MKIQFGSSSYARSRGDLPALPVRNMVFEQSPVEEDGFILQSRLALTDREADMGTSPIDQLFRRDLVLSGALFGVAGGSLYSGITSLGAIAGGGFVSMAGFEQTLFVNAGGAIYTWNGTALSSISFPDSADVAHIVVGASRLVAIRKDTGKFYWTDPLETDIEALDFATAENVPDRAKHLLFIDDILIIFGAETVEFWPNTGDATLPFAPLEARVIEKGIRATGCAAAINSTFAWVTNENQVCMGDENNVISNDGLQARLAASGECKLFRFTMNGEQYLGLRLDNETQAFNPRTGMWSEMLSYGEDNFIPQCYADGVFGSAVDGRTLEFEATGALDMAGPMERLFRAGFPINSGSFAIHNVSLRCNVGQTPYLTGDYDDPTVEMRVSRDGGKTWGNWKARNLGVQGEYRETVRWNGLGIAKAPGFLAEFRVTDPVDWRVSGVFVNEDIP